MNQLPTAGRRARPAQKRPGLSKVGAFAVVVLSLLLAAPALAQRDEPDRKPKKDADKWKEDPYTKNETEALEKAGIVKLGPIGWRPSFTSERIEQALGDVKIRWIETPHFRLGCAVKSWKVPSHPKKVRKRVYEEIARLRKKLPTVKKKPKTLSPWLRAHLFAQRLEELYAEIQEILGVTDESFPKDGEKIDGEYMGRGPYLGVKGKFNVLILQKESDCARFLSTFTPSKGTDPSRWFTAEPADCFLFATAVEFAEEAYKDDTAMWAHVQFNLVSNLTDAYRGYMYRMPVWWQEGLAHDFRREVYEERNAFSGIADKTERLFKKEFSNWEKRCYGLIKHGLTKPARVTCTQFTHNKLKFVDHIEIWSRVQFLRSLGDDKFGKLIHALSGCYTAQGTGAPKEYILKVQEQAIQDIWGWSLDEFDEAWKKWAKKKYKNAK